MSDPRDAREGEPTPGFTLPCPCGGFPTAERDRMLQALATAHGHTLATERVAWPTTRTRKDPA